ncbi:MAG: polyprenyl synthetase family protein [Candidatus Cloacimonetes bacterium]|nr:polyprenyl synthetase family protein [Candidatus Cloacimonadota bacterium]
MIILKKDMKEKRELINITLDRFLPRKDEYPKDIHKAMRHTLFAGGKRLRPYLAMTTFMLFSDKINKIRPVASAIEMLHTYTLIHDDLPDIDNDEYRRGKKTCHTVYGTDLALLAGDSMITYAFEILTLVDLPMETRITMITEMARETGYRGLINGQMADILAEGRETSKKQLAYIHENKTARLIRLAIRFGCYTARASSSDITRLEAFGDKIGLAFQIMDDILDIEGEKHLFGKTIGKDVAMKKATYPSIYGLEESREMATNLIEEAKALLEPYGEKAEALLLLSDFILTRKF